jgi:hypothetical protein
MKNDLIEFDVAVDECKVIAKSICDHQLRMGEIGANVKTIHGDKTLARLAEASNIPIASFKCYVAVWRAYEGKKLDGLTFSVLQALATVPNRAALIASNPDMTVKAARKIAAAYKKSIKPVLTDEQKLTAAWVRADKAMDSVVKLTCDQVAVKQFIKAKGRFKTVLGPVIVKATKREPIHRVSEREIPGIVALARMLEKEDPAYFAHAQRELLAGNGYVLEASPADPVSEIDPALESPHEPATLPMGDWSDDQIIEHCEDEWAKPADEKVDYTPILKDALQSIETPPESVAPYAKKPQHKEHDKAYWERHPEPAPDEGQELAA